MTEPGQLLDIRHRPDGCVVIIRDSVDVVFNKDEWEELIEYCASHSSAESSEKVLDNFMDWLYGEKIVTGGTAISKLKEFQQKERD